MDHRAASRANSYGLAVFAGKIEDYPQDQSYDLALMIMTIEHLTSPVETLRAVNHILKPGGKLVIVTDNVDSPDFHLFKGRHWGGCHFSRHLHLFSSDTLCSTAATAGFESGIVKTSFSPVNMVYSIRNWIDDWHGPRWLVNRFSLKSPVSLGVFPLIDVPLSLFGRGAILQGIFVKPKAVEIL